MLDAIKASGVTTLSRLAFAVGQPNQPLANDDIVTFLRGALGRAPSLLETSSVKRLAFETQTFLVAQLRQAIEQTDDSAPRKIAFAERHSRMEAIKTALAGLSITGELDPAHVLLDEACSMFEKNVVVYLEPASCVSRSFEALGGKQTRELILEKGALILRNQDNLSSPTDSEIKFHNAMMRRGIALQFGKLMSFAQHCEWTTYLLRLFTENRHQGIVVQTSLN